MSGSLPQNEMDVADLTGADARFSDRRVRVSDSLRITASLQVKYPRDRSRSGAQTGAVKSQV
jgi:hypothetical protein